MDRFKKPQATTGKHISEKALQHESVSPDVRPPSFSFQYLHRDYCITQCTEVERLAFVDKMRLLSQLTWSQLRQAQRHGLGYEIIRPSSIKPAIPANITDDISFIAFRFCAKKAMVGFRSIEGIFHVVWFDRDFTVYDHGS